MKFIHFQQRSRAGRENAGQLTRKFEGNRSALHTGASRVYRETQDRGYCQIKISFTCQEEWSQQVRDFNTKHSCLNGLSLIYLYLI